MWLDEGSMERWIDRKKKYVGKRQTTLSAHLHLIKNRGNREKEKVHSDAACVYSVQRRKSQCSWGSLGSWINTGAMMRQ